MTDIAELVRELRSPSGIGEPSDHIKMQTAADALERLSSHIQLHAGDCLSLDNEVQLMRDHWQEAEKCNVELRAKLERLSAPSVDDESLRESLLNDAFTKRWNERVSEEYMRPVILERAALSAMTTYANIRVAQERERCLNELDEYLWR